MHTMFLSLDPRKPRPAAWAKISRPFRAYSFFGFFLIEGLTEWFWKDFSSRARRNDKIEDSSKRVYRIITQNANQSIFHYHERAVWPETAGITLLREDSVTGNVGKHTTMWGQCDSKRREAHCHVRTVWFRTSGSTLPRCNSLLWKRSWLALPLRKRAWDHSDQWQVCMPDKSVTVYSWAFWAYHQGKAVPKLRVHTKAGLMGSSASGSRTDQ